MKNLLILSILIATIFCEQQGNLLRCFVEIGKTIKAGVEFGVSLVEENPVGVIKSSIAIVKQIDPLITECSNPICLKEAEKRCEKDTGKQCEQWGAIMYPKCKAGFKPFGCCLCVPVCPAGFRDDGLFCAKPASYGRGAGYPWKFGDSLNLDGARKRCLADHKDTGCEQNGAIIYPKCKKGFHNVGCCVCSPNCPAGMTDIGVSCQKKGSYGRGAGYPMYYNDCSNTKTKSTPITYGSVKLTVAQLKTKIQQLTQKLKQNQKNSVEATKVAQDLSYYISQYQSKVKG